MTTIRRMVGACALLSLTACSDTTQVLMPVAAPQPLHANLTPALPVGALASGPEQPRLAPMGGVGSFHANREAPSASPGFADGPTQSYTPNTTFSAGSAGSRTITPAVTPPTVSTVSVGSVTRQPRPLPPPSATTQATAAPAIAPPTADTSSVLSRSKLDIAPVTGVPEEALAALGQSIAQRSQEIGLPTGSPPTHRLKGYFSTNDDGRETRVIYIWDVIDNEGRRLHRIQGQEVVAGSAGDDSWNGIPASTLRSIGRTAVDRFAEWRRSV